MNGNKRKKLAWLHMMFLGLAFICTCDDRECWHYINRVNCPKNKYKVVFP
jgi:hypothetical protein